MKKIITLITGLILSVSAVGQVVVQIGTGTLSATGSNYLPIYRSSAASSFDFSRAYYLYTAAELSAAGIPAGSTITKVEWDKSNTGATIATTANVVFNIYMNNSGSTGYTTAQTWGTLTSGATMVYANNNQVIPATTGYLPFTLTTPFVYNGAALEVSTDWDISAVSGNPTTAGFSFSYSAVSNRVGGTSNSAALNNSTSMTTQSNRPNIRITYTPPPPCAGTPTPGTAVASNTLVCATSTVNLNLTGSTNASGLTYQWYSSPNGSGWTPITTGTTISITETVSATTYYQAEVSCGANTATSSIVIVNFGLTPNAGTSVASASLVCPGNTVGLSLSGATSAPGIGYQWYSSPNGVTYSAITNATLISTTQSVASSMYYQNVSTCGAATSTSSPIQVQTASTTISNVPYFEGFEGITANNQLPNCSWAASNLPTINKTYTAATGSYNQFAQTGNKFASFRYGTNTAGDYFYTNGIQLTAGITYSASVGYITDGATGWSNFSLLYGTAQSSTGLVAIASATGNLQNTTYSTLANTFTVPSSGVYYIAVKAIGNSTPWYLTWDDLSIIQTNQCSGTPASNTVIASPTVVCLGGNSNLSLNTGYASTGITYQWSSSTSSVGPYTSIPGATLSTFSATNITTPIWFQADIGCSFSSSTITATPTQVNILGAPVYASVPFLESFDNVWQNRCDIRNVPVMANWSSNPTTGNSSWRRQNDGSSANWTSPSTGIVPPIGSGSADFHSYYAPNGSTGNLDVYLDMSAPGNNVLSFYNYNSSGTDSLLVYFSTNGGSSFSKIGGYKIATNWTKQSITLGSVLSSSCIVRFMGKSDFGNDDIGLDSVAVNVVACTTPPFAGAISGPNNVSVGSTNNYTISPSTGNLQWYQSTNINGPYTSIGGATSSTANIVASPVGTVYYTVIASSSGCINDTSNVAFSVTVNPLPGDMSCNPIAITNFTANTYYKLNNMSVQSGEVAPPGSSCSSNSAWCNNTLNNTMWFTFTAPASGNVAVQSPGFDTQLAVWSTTNCAALASPTNAVLIAANDDDSNASSHGGVTFSSYLYALCLNPGATYYIQLDSYGTTSASDSTKIVITDLGANSFTGAASGYCLPSAVSASLTPNIPGGIFSINSSTTVTAFTPSVTGAGTFTLSYTLYGCISSSIVTVDNTPTVTAAAANPTVCQGGSTSLNASGANTYTWNTSATSSVIAVTPSVTTTYTVTGDANGCTDSDTVVVTVNGLPTVSLTASQMNACVNGSTISLTGSPLGGVYTGTNVSGNVFTPGTSTGTFMPVYSVTDATTGCSNSASTTIIVNALPSLSLSASSTTACTNGSTIALTGSPSGGVYGGSNVAGNIFTPPAVSGTFTPSYSYTDAITGCSNNTNTSIIVSVCTDISKNTQGLTGLQVYPNPNTGEFTIELNNGAGKKVELSDLTGRIILTEVNNNDRMNINISNLANGVYFVKVQSNNSVEIVRIIKQ